MSRVEVTTSIAYINAEPHIGFLLELVAADVLARYQRQIGNDVFFLTGTDEHGIKIQQAIEASGKQPQEYADEISGKFEQLSKDFNISNDYFIRTTNPDHIKFVQDIWQQLERAGAITKKSYDGLYCTGCEAFKTEREIVDGKCVIHEKPVEKVSEENWFLTISDEAKAKITDWLPAIEPSGRRNEVASALKEITEVSISRPKAKLSWGVPVPGDDDQTMYVWVDALFNYLSGLKLAGKEISDYWPHAIQVIGKDILKFHAIIWPTLLLACGYELPDKLLVHGFVSVDGKKMSKSLGNVITPAQLKERYGTDATRYLLLRQLNFYDDSNFSWAEFDAIYNGELANGIGNLLARVTSLLKRFSEKHLATVSAQIALAQNEAELPEQYVRGLEAFDLKDDLIYFSALLKSADEWITRQQPWKWSEEDCGNKLKIAELIDQSKLYAIAILLEPYMPETAKEIRRQLTELDPKPLFPRLSA